MTNVKKIKSLFLKLNYKPLKISSISEGLVNEVFDVKTNNGSFIVRIEPPHFDNFIKTLKVMNLCYKKRIIHNKVIFNNNKKKIMIVEKIEGSNLLSVVKSLSDREVFTILKKALVVINKISKIKTKGYGRLNNDLIGEFNNPLNEVNARLKDLDYLMKKGVLTLDVVSKINTLFKSNKDLFNNNQRLIYTDLSFSNIIVNNKRFNGLIDFDGCISGDPIRRFRTLYFVCFGSKYEQIINDLMDLKNKDLLKLKLYVIMFILVILKMISEGKIKERVNYAGLRVKEVLNQLIA